jgi:hypothetical protein
VLTGLLRVIRETKPARRGRFGSPQSSIRISPSLLAARTNLTSAEPCTLASVVVACGLRSEKAPPSSSPRGSAAQGPKLDVGPRGGTSQCDQNDSGGVRGPLTDSASPSEWWKFGDDRRQVSCRDRPFNCQKYWDISLAAHSIRSGPCHLLDAHHRLHSWRQQLIPLLKCNR